TRCRHERAAVTGPRLLQTGALGRLGVQHAGGRARAVSRHREGHLLGSNTGWWQAPARGRRSARGVGRARVERPRESSDHRADPAVHWAGRTVRLPSNLRAGSGPRSPYVVWRFYVRSRRRSPAARVAAADASCAWERRPVARVAGSDDPIPARRIPRTRHWQRGGGLTVERPPLLAGSPRVGGGPDQQSPGWERGPA